MCKEAGLVVEVDVGDLSVDTVGTHTFYNDCETLDS